MPDDPHPDEETATLNTTALSFALQYCESLPERDRPGAAVVIAIAHAMRRFLLTGIDCEPAQVDDASERIVLGPTMPRDPRSDRA